MLENKVFIDNFLPVLVLINQDFKIYLNYGFSGL
jgi:hypothetical protein